MEKNFKNDSLQSDAGLETMNLCTALRTELLDDILPFWEEKMIDPRGGFYGRINGEGGLEAEAPKAAVLNARILWTFSSAYRLFGKKSYEEVARRAFRYMTVFFEDSKYGGLYWNLEASGIPLDTKKQIYAQAFGIYGFAEYFRATADPEALDVAVRLYHLVEKYSFDKVKNGYLEAFSRDWNELSDMRLSEKDDNASKTMNTHLHVLEAYTSLYRVWKDEGLRLKLENLIFLFLEKIILPDGHLGLFFDKDWVRKSEVVSFGHEIETSWLLYEAALASGNDELIARVRPYVRILADSAAEGFSPEGGLCYEENPVTGVRDRERHWWVQAEALVGYFNLWQLESCPEDLDKVMEIWRFIDRNLVDHENGEWFWSILADGTANKEEDKAGCWKCPYHNGRMCMEILERLSKIENMPV